MKKAMKKIQILSLAAFVGLGAASVINEVPIHHSTSSKYILSGYFPNKSLSRSTQNLKLQSTSAKVTLPANTQYSSNWGGYIASPASNTGYTSISGSWTVPNISTNPKNGVAAQWIGLGGVTSSDLLQMGTVEQVQNGQPMAEVFWEQLPSAAQNVAIVPIGSTINVNISEVSNSTWNLTFTVTTPNNQKQSKTIATTLDSTYSQGIGTSAEWISEDPSNINGQLVPLANMGTVKYNSATVNGQPINDAHNNVEPVALISNSNTVLIAPSNLGTDGESFSTISTNQNTTGGVKSMPAPFNRHTRNRFTWPWR